MAWCSTCGQAFTTTTASPGRLRCPTCEAWEGPFDARGDDQARIRAKLNWEAEYCIKQARADALEEAARVADNFAHVAKDADKCAVCDDGPRAGRSIAHAIRGLKDKEG